MKGRVKLSISLFILFVLNVLLIWVIMNYA
jgi:hypothetical protein